MVRAIERVREGWLDAGRADAARLALFCGLFWAAVRSDVLDWPYIEGLRMDEAMHPLTILGVGVYGEVLPNQCGAPLRLVVPWKYGLKSIKSIVKIRFVEKQPLGSWQRSYPQAYGFYANVNPAVTNSTFRDHVFEARMFAIGAIAKIPVYSDHGFGEGLQMFGFEEADDVRHAGEGVGIAMGHSHAAAG